MTPVVRNSLVLLLIVAFAIRLAAGWVWQSRLDGRFGMGDSESYWALGLDIAEGRPYEYGPDHARVFRTPGYPLLLAPILRLAGDNQTAVLLARAEAALFGVLAVAAVWWIARLLFDDRAALLAAALATFYPGAIALNALILSEGPFCPLMLLQLAFWTLAWRAQTPARMTLFAFCGGLAAGAATLMRPSWLLFTPLAVGVELLLTLITVYRLSDASGATTPRDCGRGEPDSPLRPPRPQSRGVVRCGTTLTIASCMIAGLVLAMLPWWIRNACVTGHFVPTTLQVGASLYDGLNPDATGASNMDFVPRFAALCGTAAPGCAENQTQPGAAVPHFKTVPNPQDSLELRLDQRLRAEAIAWAKANPGQVLQLAGVKFLRMWNIWPNEPRLTAWPIRLGVLFTYTPVLFFAIIGVWRTFGRGWPYLLCVLPAVYLTLLHTVFVSSIRYREPAMLALLALAAGAIATTKSKPAHQPLAVSQ